MRPILPRLVFSIAGALLLLPPITAFEASARTNVVNYWGQNGASAEGDLAEYCQNDTIDILVLAFLARIEDNLPGLDFANHCKETYPGTSILHCPKMAQDIKFCQSQGKAVILSIGGASGSYAIGDSAAGQAFAKTIWDMFLGGSSETRPFEDAILDGVDLDLEDGATQGYVGFLETLRDSFAGSSRQYYITGAPQCPMPNRWFEPMMVSSWFDMLFVQFYNHNCGADKGSFNFAAWNEWATSSSINKSVKIYLGVPGGPGAAGSNVLSADQLIEVISQVQSYSNFGGVMMWDAGSTSVSGLAAVAARALAGGGRRRDPPLPTLHSPQEPSSSPDHPTPDEPSPEYPESPEPSCPEDTWDPWTGHLGWADWPDLPQRPKDPWYNKRADNIKNRSVPSPSDPADRLAQRVTTMPSPGSKKSTHGIKMMRMTKSRPAPPKRLAQRNQGSRHIPQRQPVLRVVSAVSDDRQDRQFKVQQRQTLRPSRILEADNRHHAERTVDPLFYWRSLLPPVLIRPLDHYYLLAPQ
ncbi:Chitinase 1 [Mortierella alpina]|nr:Chitinase 1 [Mortierella alpina]